MTTSFPQRSGTDPTKQPLPAPDGVSVISAAAIQPERVEWLWLDRIPRGTLTLLVGDPGLGKSLLSIDLAARLSRGELGEAGVAMLATGEDIASATVVPRLIAAGADLAQVQLVRHSVGGAESVLQLPRDASGLRAQVEQTDNLLPKIHADAGVVLPPMPAHVLACDVRHDRLRPEGLGPLERLNPSLEPLAYRFAGEVFLRYGEKLGTSLSKLRRRLLFQLLHQPKGRSRTIPGIRNPVSV